MFATVVGVLSYKTAIQHSLPCPRATTHTEKNAWLGSFAQSSKSDESPTYQRLRDGEAILDSLAGAHQRPSLTHRVRFPLTGTLR